MDFGNKLLEARRARGMNQEALAEALGVSRQTIYKWESGITYPDIDVLFKIAEQLGVSTSYLLGECEDAPTENAEGKSTVLRHFTKFARMIGGATLLILLSVAALLMLCTRQTTLTTALGVAALLTGVFAAVICYVVAGLRHEAFLKENTYTVFFEKEEKRHSRRIFAAKIAVGLSLIFLGVLAVVLLGIFDVAESLLVASVALLLAFIGVACYLFITAGILDELLSDPEKALMTEDERKGKKNAEEAIGGVIMTLATAVFLFFGFMYGAWHPAWIAFPIGGVLCGGVSSVLKLCGKGSSQNREEGGE